MGVKMAHVAKMAPLRDPVVPRLAATSRKVQNCIGPFRDQCTSGRQYARNRKFPQQMSVSGGKRRSGNSR